MLSKPLCHAALATALVACGSEEMFELQLGATERAIGSVAVAQITADNRDLGDPVPVGDLDGDGHDDAIVRADAWEDSGGRIHLVSDAYVIYGGAAVTGSIDLATLPHLSELGDPATEIVPLGDVDGDGLSDVLLTSNAPGAPNNTTPRGAYLVYGRAARLSGATLLRDAGVLLQDPAQSYGPASVTSLGDLDGDGRADFAIASSPQAAGQLARIFVFYGRSVRPTGPVDITTAFDASITAATDSGVTVTGIGDVDGDGRPDFLVGTMHQEGADGPFATDLQMVRGPATRFAGAIALGDIATTRFVNDAQPVDWLTAGASLGDLDGDGITDFTLRAEVRPAPLTDTSLRHLVFYGRAGGFPTQVAASSADATIATGGGWNSRASSVAAIDRDGHRDLVVGDPLSRDRNGAISLIRAASGRLEGTVDLANRQSFVGVPRRADNCDFATHPGCSVHEGVGGGIASAAVTGGDHPNLLVTGSLSGVPPLAIHGSSFARLYVLSLPAAP